MKNLSIHLAIMVVVTAIAGVVGTSPVNAQTALVFQVGTQAPPPSQPEHRWASPSHSAVWIPGHNELRDGRYSWVSGYYDYPPRPHSHWVAPQYPHTQTGYSYHPGHWSD
jgi:hypothetical protein